MQRHREHTAPRVPLLERIGDFAVWPGLYASGCLLLLGWLIGTPTDARRLAIGCVFVSLCAVAGYMLDRVKISSERLDPADQQAQPVRSTRIRRLQRPLRAGIVAALGLAMIVGLGLHPTLALVPPLVGVGVWLYAGRPADPESPRPKDWPLAKGAIVGVAHTALAGATLAAIDPGVLGRPTPYLIAAASLACLVLADAVLCDLDDEAADRAWGTGSVPVRLGRAWAWVVAASGHGACVAFAATLLEPRGTIVLGLLLAASLAISGALRRRRDFIDARLILVAVICLWLG